MQGGVLSPKLFIVYLDEALQSNTILADAIVRELISAFADDLNATSHNEIDIEEITRALESLEHEWGLKLNKRKC